MAGKMDQHDKDLRHFVSSPLINIIFASLYPNGGTGHSLDIDCVLHFSFYTQVSLYNAGYRTA